MTPERFEAINELFVQALALEGVERAAFLAAACGEDAELRHEVDSLLAAHDGGGDFLDNPIAGVGAAGALSDRAADDLASTVRDPNAPDTSPGVRGATGFVTDPMGRVGTVVDGVYHVERFLGQGAMGTVYLARHSLLRDRVALKFLPRGIATAPIALERFQREGRVARLFRHPNSVTVYDLRVSSDGSVYLVLEYVEGRTLREELGARGRYSPSEALDLLEPIAGVLDAAHGRGVLHRDLKPDNVMVGQDSNGEQLVKVLDLGIAKVLEGAEAQSIASGLTEEGRPIGTPVFMSPEQWGEPSRDGVPELDGRTDIFSLAVMTYQLVAGKNPFIGESYAEVRRRIVGHQPSTLDDVVEGVPAAFARAVARGMAKDRSDRPRTAGALIAELRSAMSDPVEPAPPTPEILPAREDEPPPTVSESTEAPPRRRIPVAAVAVLGVVVAGSAVGLYATRGWRAQEPAPPHVVAPPTPPPHVVAEVLRYSLEISEGEEDRPVTPASEDFVTADQQFRFHVTPAADGYLYIVALGRGDAPTTFLTAQPPARSGVTSNRVRAGKDFTFPMGARKWIGIEDTGRPTVYTMIFSPEPLSDPPFLAARAPHELRPDELFAWGAARKRFVEGTAERGADGDARPATLVRADGGQVVFDVTIRHR